MRKLLYVGAAVAALTISSGAGNAMAINIGAGLKPALDASDATQKVAVFIVEGYRYCFYFDGWHGPGWYRCGYARRRNLGWGGEYGWQSWSYGPAERRYGRGATVRGRIERPDRNVERGTTIRRSPPEAGPRGGTGVRDSGHVQRNAAPPGGRPMQMQMQRSAPPAGGNQSGGGRTGGASGGGQGGGKGGGPGGDHGGGSDKH